MMTMRNQNRAALLGFHRMSAALLLALVLGPGVSGRLLCQSNYTSCAVHDGGMITGKVTLGGAVCKFDQLAVSQDKKTCGRMKTSPRLCLSKDRGVADAIVYLEGISRGKCFQEEEACLLTQHNCEYQPHTLIVPAGKCLRIVNNDAILHNVHTYEDAKEPKTVFNIAQPIKGVKSTTKPLSKPGLIKVTCDAGHPWMSATIMVAAHPYYAITDKNGCFSLTDVPPGSYTLRMWHEGIAVVNKELEHDKVKKYEYEQPYEASRQVTVSSQATVKADFDLTLR